MSMVISGTEAARQASPEEVAEQTLKCLKENVPGELLGLFPIWRTKSRTVYFAPQPYQPVGGQALAY